MATPEMKTLLGSLIFYPAVYFAILPARPSSLHIARARESISIFHCGLQTVLAAICLRSNAKGLESPASHGNVQVPRGDVPIITTNSAFGNCITALETGYLLQDSAVLLHAYWRRNGTQGKQHYIAQGREKGILVIVALHLMNASSVPGTLRWFLLNFKPHRRRLINGMTVLYLASFAVFRVGLIFWIIKVFATQQRVSFLVGVSRLKLPCKAGTGLITMVNVWWLLSGLQKFSARAMR
ncbi:uncharacterized protein LTR77_007008 [Saxophila tyrrhenica]|uniref:TLC domain-containing protein n=1 Tax=Saxophila tyrrhenica TaxID=1690608 RepID=A0AAV9P6Z3_9PEZI|nr:hypothetical protein LTR77_007008 [Saxophila tyrrhenica]